jgi:hypothetical protein
MVSNSSRVEEESVTAIVLSHDFSVLTLSEASLTSNSSGFVIGGKGLPASYAAARQNGLPDRAGRLPPRWTLANRRVSATHPDGDHRKAGV